MPIPLNAIAETIVQLQASSAQAAMAIEQHTSVIAKNEASITQLEPLAEWGPDPVVEAPTPIPGA